MLERTPGQEAMGEAHVPTEQPQTSQEPWLPAPDVDPGRTSDPEVPPPQGAQAPLGLIWRIRDRATFRELRVNGRRARRGPLTVTFVVRATDDPPQVAFAVGRKVGGAVVRNKLR